MSKFCGNCGAVVNDDARICGNCGTPLGEGSVKKAIIPGVAKEIAPATKAKIVKGVKIVVALAIVAIIAVLAVKIISANTGYRGVIKNAVSAVKKTDGAKFAKFTSPVAKDLYDSVFEGSDDSIEDFYEDMLDSIDEYFEDKVDSKYKLKYEIKKASDVKDKKLKDLKEVLSDDYDIDADSIKQIKEIELKLVAKHKDDSTKRNIKLYMSKEGGKWYILAIEGSGWYSIIDRGLDGNSVNYYDY